MSAPFPIEIVSPWRADVYLSLGPTVEVPERVLRAFDERRIRLIGAVPEVEPSREQLESLVSACQCMVLVGDPQSSGQRAAQRELERALAHAMSLQVLHLTDSVIASERLLKEAVESLVVASPIRAPAYAFFAGRLEKDFCHARAAVRAAVEWELGMPCLWSDDGHLHPTSSGVRETTQTLIRHASLVIADLSLGPENPHHENPSRAHEIGLAIAFGRPIMLSSREPRRYPYFSIGDMQMFFWSDERDLWYRASEWLRAHRGRLGRRVFNRELTSAKVDRKPFEFAASQSYRWPETKPLSPLEFGLIALGAASAVLLTARSQRPYSLAVMVGLLSTSVAPPTLRWFQKRGRARALSLAVVSMSMFVVAAGLGYWANTP